MHACNSVLPDIIEAVNGKAPVVVDGGFYRGTDLVKAYALALFRSEKKNWQDRVSRSWK